MRESAASVLAQTRRPDLWVIVDDGSTDDTPGILRELAAEHAFIRVITLPDRGHRRVGAGVVDAFNAGLLAAGGADSCQFLSKLDLDLALPPRYYETLLRLFEHHPSLGTCSGKSLVWRGRQLVLEGQGSDMSLGMAKVYRSTCFQAIGGLVTGLMWDGIDCHRARMLGWQACSVDHADVNFIHLRPMGSSHRSLLHGRFRHGRGQHFMGTGPLYMLASAINWCRHPPYLLGGAAMLAGWWWAALRGLPRFEDSEFRQYLRRYHRRVLRFGKRDAASQIDSLMQLHPKGAQETRQTG